VIVVDWCYMCKKDGENVDCLLLHCDYAENYGLSCCVCLGAVGRASLSC
jgi:hypothetical protein